MREDSFQDKNVLSTSQACVCVPLYLFYFIKNIFAVINCTRLKSTFGIRVVIGFRGMPLWLRVWLGSVISLVTVGDLQY
jgi:hypothetical protein